MDQRIHEHSLTFKEATKNDGPPEFCNGCLEPVLGPHYTCDVCKLRLQERRLLETRLLERRLLERRLLKRRRLKSRLMGLWLRMTESPLEESRLQESRLRESLIIHKPCAELPREIHHPIHPIHPLILTADLYHHGSKCGVCSLSPPEGFFLAYYCSECNFWIDIKCAFKLQNAGHEHNFTMLSSSSKFTCDVCGQGDDNLQYNFYVCKICQLIVHRTCSWLPIQVKLSWHQHRLKLTWWFQDMYPKDQYFCDICSENMDGNRAMYCCHDHECRDYAAHCKCLRREGIIMNVLFDDNDDNEPSTSRCPPANETIDDDNVE